MKPMDAAQQSGWACRWMKYKEGRRISYWHKDGQFIEVLHATDGTIRVLNAAAMPGLKVPEDWKPEERPDVPESILTDLKSLPLRTGRLSYVLTKDVAATIRWNYEGSGFVGAMYWDGSTLPEEIKVDHVLLFSDWAIIKEWPC